MTTAYDLSEVTTTTRGELLHDQPRRRLQPDESLGAQQHDKDEPTRGSVWTEGSWLDQMGEIGLLLLALAFAWVFGRCLFTLVTRRRWSSIFFQSPNGPVYSKVRTTDNDEDDNDEEDDIGEHQDFLQDDESIIEENGLCDHPEIEMKLIPTECGEKMATF